MAERVNARPKRRSGPRYSTPAGGKARQLPLGPCNCPDQHMLKTIRVSRSASAVDHGGRRKFRVPNGTGRHMAPGTKRHRVPDGTECQMPGVCDARRNQHSQIGRLLAQWQSRSVTRERSIRCHYAGYWVDCFAIASDDRPTGEGEPFARATGRPLDGVAAGSREGTAALRPHPGFRANAVKALR